MIYLVISKESRTICAAFSTLRGAKAYVDGRPNANEYSIEEHEVDPITEKSDICEFCNKRKTNRTVKIDIDPLNYKNKYNVRSDRYISIKPEILPICDDCASLVCIQSLKVGVRHFAQILEIK